MRMMVKIVMSVMSMLRAGVSIMMIPHPPGLIQWRARYYYCYYYCHCAIFVSLFCGDDHHTHHPTHAPLPLSSCAPPHDADSHAQVALRQTELHC